ncbi:MAG: MmcQ/YjbR family DNA-binding protein [Candidatus Peribacteria bacterium]|nr:MmcQ/YjbR family DNA-binding protein [Candidatus Peribacteria bacterium]
MEENKINEILILKNSMTKREIINFCLTLPDTYKDYPFFDTSSNPTTVMRHHYNQKSFALIIHHDNKTYLNLKHNPFEIEFLRDIYKSIIP